MFDVKPFETTLERYNFDEVLGWKTRKSHTTFISKRAYAHHLYYDKDGYPSRKEDVNNSASREQPSIAIIGDSFIEGYYLPYEKTIAHRLNRQTVKKVLNFGVSGYSPGQYLLTARQKLHKYNIRDIVVFLFAFNDVPFVNRDTYLGYAKPFVSEHTYMPTNIPLERKRGEKDKRRFIKKFLDKFALWSLIKPLISPAFPLADIIVEPQKLSYLDMEKALKLIGQIHIENPNPSFHVYYIPDMVELKKREFFNYNIENFVQICSKLDLKCIVPTPLLEEKDIERLYLVSDRHLSELGINLIANQLHNLLKNDANH